MNIQGSSILRHRAAERDREPVRWGLVAMIGLIAAAALVIPNFYIYLNQQISAADKSIRQMRTELAGVEREIDSYRLQYENYSAWPHIRESIRKFNLPLRQSTPDQCRRLAMIPPSLAPAIAISFRDPAALQQQPTAQLPNGRANRRPAGRSGKTGYPAFRWTRN